MANACSRALQRVPVPQSNDTQRLSLSLI